MNEQSGSDTGSMEHRQSDNQGQRTVQQAMEYPLEQSIRVQKGAAQLLLSGLEMGTKAQSRSVELTKDVFDSYIRTLERAAQDTEQLAQTATKQIQSQSATMQQQGQRAVSEAASAFGNEGAQGAPQYGGQQQGSLYGQGTQTSAGTGNANRQPGVGAQGSGFQGQPGGPQQQSYRGQQYGRQSYQQQPQDGQYGTQQYGRGHSYAYQGIHQPQMGGGSRQSQPGVTQPSTGQGPTQERTSPGMEQGGDVPPNQPQGSAAEQGSGGTQETYPETQQ